MAKITCFVRGQTGAILTGKINSVQLIPFIGKKVELSIKVVE